MFNRRSILRSSAAGVAGSLLAHPTSFAQGVAGGATRGGTLTVAIFADPLSFDPHITGNPQGRGACRAIHGSLLTINKANRLNLNLKSTDGSLLTEAERGVIQQPGSQPTVAGDPDPARFRSLVGDVRDLALTASWSRGLGAMGQDGSLAFNGAIERSDSRSLAGLDVVRLTAPDGSSAVRSQRWGVHMLPIGATAHNG